MSGASNRHRDDPSAGGMVEKCDDERRAVARIGERCARSTSRPGTEAARKTTTQISEQPVRLNGCKGNGEQSGMNCARSSCSFGTRAEANEVLYLEKPVRQGLLTE